MNESGFRYAHERYEDDAIHASEEKLRERMSEYVSEGDPVWLKNMIDKGAVGLTVRRDAGRYYVVATFENPSVANIRDIQDWQETEKQRRVTGSESMPVLKEKDVMFRKKFDDLKQFFSGFKPYEVVILKKKALKEDILEHEGLKEKHERQPEIVKSINDEIELAKKELLELDAEIDKLEPWHEK